MTDDENNEIQSESENQIIQVQVSKVKLKNMLANDLLDKIITESNIYVITSIFKSITKEYNIPLDELEKKYMDKFKKNEQYNKLIKKLLNMDDSTVIEVLGNNTNKSIARKRGRPKTTSNQINTVEL